MDRKKDIIRKKNSPEKDWELRMLWTVKKILLGRRIHLRRIGS